MKPHRSASASASTSPHTTARRPWHRRDALGALSALLILQTGCSSVMPVPSGDFLHTPASLLQADPADESRASRAPSAPLGGVRWRVLPVVWNGHASPDTTPAEQARLCAHLQTALQTALAALPTAPEGPVVEVRATIVRAEPVSVVLNTVATALLIGPLDRGGAAVEIEALTAVERTPLAALRIGRFTPLRELGLRFERWASAEAVLQTAATEFAALVQANASQR